MSNIDNLTYGEIKQLVAMFGNTEAANKSLDNGMIGEYVIVRCRDGGVHSGYLKSHNGRECVLTESRRLWYWKVKTGSGDFLSSISINGVHGDSKIGEAVESLHLTENCEIIKCTRASKESIEGAPIHGK